MADLRNKIADNVSPSPETPTTGTAERATECPTGLADYDKSLIFLRFSGCGWLLSFHAGVGKFFQDHMRVEDERMRFGGESGGSLVCATLATGMDVSAVYEESLKMYEPCKNLPFRMGSMLKKALNKLGPGDEAWKAASGKMVIGLSRMDIEGVKLKWHAERVTEFHSREHAISVLRASCHLPAIGGARGMKTEVYEGGRLLHKHRYFDGGIAELYPCMKPQDFLLPDQRADGTPPADHVYNINVCAWGNAGEGYHICPGFNVPIGWFFFPANPGCLLKMYRLGYLRAAEMFCRVPPRFAAGLWRRAAFDAQQLPAIQAKIQEVLDDLLDEDAFCCSLLLGFRNKKAAPRAPDPVELDPASGISNLPLDDGEESFSLADAKSIPGEAAAAAIKAAEALGTGPVQDIIAQPVVGLHADPRAQPTSVQKPGEQDPAAASFPRPQQSVPQGRQEMVIAHIDLTASSNSTQGRTASAASASFQQTACLSPQPYHIDNTSENGSIASESPRATSRHETPTKTRAGSRMRLPSITDRMRANAVKPLQP